MTLSWTIKCLYIFSQKEKFVSENFSPVIFSTNGRGGEGRGGVGAPIFLSDNNVNCLKSGRLNVKNLVCFKGRFLSQIGKFSLKEKYLDILRVCPSRSWVRIPFKPEFFQV